MLIILRHIIFQGLRVLTWAWKSRYGSVPNHSSK